MNIDITKLLTNSVSNIKIDSLVNIPEEYLENSLIEELNNVKVTGKVYFNEENDLELVGSIMGTMTLRDDLTLELVKYDFCGSIEEFLENNKNILDITDVLWQNILVEIPSKVRKTDEEANLSGNGWRVISEDTYLKEMNSNNPFSNLDKLINKKEAE